MKKVLKIMALLALLLGLCACAAKEPEPEASPTPAPTATPEPEKLPTVKISELMTNNVATLLDGDGRFSPWVELYNYGEETAELTGCVLSWKNGSVVLAEQSVRPGEYALVFCPEDGESSLPKKGGKLVLQSPRGTEIDRVELPDMGKDQSACRLDDGSAVPADWATPGFENSQAGLEAFMASRTCASPLVINEVMVYNEWYLPQNGQYYDWVELKNVSDESLELSDFTLADKGGTPCQLPKGTLEPGGLFIVYCTGEEGVGLPFALSAERERLYLSDASGAVLDYASLSGLRLGGSYGRMEGQNGYFYFDRPTPREENAAGARSIARSPELLGSDGIFNDVDSVTVALTGEGEIYYTLDGSRPTVESLLYTGPLTLTETTVLRAVSIREGQLPSESLDMSFIINEGHVLPVVSLVMDPADLFGRGGGIYANPTQDWEKPGTVMFYEDGQGFSLTCGVKMHGATSRVNQSKKSFKLNFRSRYGGELDYDLFHNGVTNFVSVILRADQEEHFSTMMRDNIMHQLAIQTFPALPVQDYRSAVLYLNGAYWGIYNIREAHSPTHYANHYGYDVETVSHWQGRWGRGSNPDELYKFVLSHDLSKDENYEYVAQHVNVESVIAWCIIETYSGNFDINSPNMRFYYSTEDDVLTYALVDLDLGMFEFQGFGNTFYFGYDYNTLVGNLLKNAQFKELFLERLSEALKGPLSTENVLAVMDELADELRPEIPRECERWGNTLKGWERMVEGLKNYMTGYGYTSVARSMVRSIDSFFHLSHEDEEMYFGDVQ